MLGGSPICSVLSFVEIEPRFQSDLCIMSLEAILVLQTRNMNTFSIRCVVKHYVINLVNYVSYD